MPDKALVAGPAVIWAGTTPYQGAAPASTTDHALLVQCAAAALLAMTVIFNPALAWVNASIMPVNGGMVAVVQGALTIAALGIGLYAGARAAALWLSLAWLLAMAALAAALIRGQFDPKGFGDVLLIPAFIMLGMQFRSATLIRTVLWLQGIVLLVGVWEVLSPAGFGSFFKVAQYYISSRGYSAEDFWAGGDLFVSAQRPHGRMLFPGSGLHRGSSVFLEPVSLGNWAIMITLFVAGFWDRLGIRQRLFFIASNFALLVICDGRLALGVCAVLIAVLPFVRRVPGWISVTYLPISLLILTIAKALGFLAEVGDTFAGRLRYGLDALGRLSVERFFAITESRIGNEDAGLVYFIQNQSLPIAIMLWVVVMLADTGERFGARAFKHGMAIFLVACLPISNASISIKTTALMWVCFGYFYAQARRNRSADKDGSRRGESSI